MRCMRSRSAAGYLRAVIFATLATSAGAALAGALAPDPATTQEAVVQVYGARTMGVKGIFGVHTWVAVKPTEAKQWTVYEVIGWRLRYQDTALVISHREQPWHYAQFAQYLDELFAEVSGETVADPAVRHSLADGLYSVPLDCRVHCW